ncbi:MAG: hypothetical protein QCH99_03075 [Candidatus Bathyarchaeota archaeon]|nr:hypothetical protein [Candidatus Bathyarchaeum tardum]WGM88652.1 MAG: hypothetical protein NUK63_06935 [Candidatus Bathyarchaeum tardum]
MTDSQRQIILRKINQGTRFDEWSQITELEIAQKLAVIFGFNNIELFPILTNGKEADSLVSHKRKKIYGGNQLQKRGVLWKNVSIYPAFGKQQFPINIFSFSNVG